MARESITCRSFARSRRQPKTSNRAMPIAHAVKLRLRSKSANFRTTATATRCCKSSASSRLGTTEAINEATEGLARFHNSSMTARSSTGSMRLVPSGSIIRPATSKSAPNSETSHRDANNTVALMPKYCDSECPKHLTIISISRTFVCTDKAYPRVGGSVNPCFNFSLIFSEFQNRPSCVLKGDP